MGVMAMLFDDDDDVKATENGVIKKAKIDKLDVSKMVRMSLVHDMAECITGDITPYDKISEDEKHRRESEAMKNLGMSSFVIGSDAIFHIPNVCDLLQIKTHFFITSCHVAIFSFKQIFKAVRRI